MRRSGLRPALQGTSHDLRPHIAEAGRRAKPGEGGETRLPSPPAPTLYTRLTHQGPEGCGLYPHPSPPTQHAKLHHAQPSDPLNSNARHPRSHRSAVRAHLLHLHGHGCRRRSGRCRPQMDARSLLRTSRARRMRNTCVYGTHTPCLVHETFSSKPPSPSPSPHHARTTPPHACTCYTRPRALSKGWSAIGPRPAPPR